MQLKHHESENKPVATTPALTEHATAIRQLGKRVVTDVIEIGRHLAEAKKIAGHGNWLPWLKHEFGWTEMTATRFMNVYEMSKSNNLLDLELPISSLYLLAAPSTPEETRTELIERAKSGEVIKLFEIKENIKATKAPPEPARKSSPVRTGENADDPEASAEHMKRHLAALDDEPDSDIEDEIKPETAAQAKTATKAKSRPARWLAAATAAAEWLRELQDLQSEYQDWRDSLPENLQGSATSEKLDAVCDLDIASALSTAEEAEGLDLPLGFGRDE
jgi:hypothetical protein